MKYALSDLINTEMSRTLMESFNGVISIGSAIVDIAGEVLIGVDGAYFCTDLHPADKDSCTWCIVKDIKLANAFTESLIMQKRYG